MRLCTKKMNGVMMITRSMSSTHGQTFSKGIEMQKIKGMHRQTKETIVDPTVILKLMREVSNFQF